MSLTDFIANVVAATHIGYFLFVVGGFASIVIGAAKGWTWIRNPWFRVTHLAAVYIVILEDTFKIQCPLNTIEWQLRATSNAAAVSPSAAGRFLDYLLFQTISGLVLDVIYWSLGVTLVVLLFLVKPRPFRKPHLSRA